MSCLAAILLAKGSLSMPYSSVMADTNETRANESESKEATMPENLTADTFILTTTIAGRPRILSHHTTFAEALRAHRAHPHTSSTSITTWGAFKALLEAVR